MKFPGWFDRGQHFPGSKGQCNRRSIVPALGMLFVLAPLTRALCSNENGAPHLTVGRGSEVRASANGLDLSASETIPLESYEACEVQAIALGANTKNRGFLRGLFHVTFFSQ